MRELTRRDVLGGTVGAATLFAGCSESSSSGAFTQTAVADQQLIVEFEESLDAETISVIDPDGESFGEMSISAGVTRVTFDIEMPYTPGEYRIVAVDGGETIAETSQEIRPELEIEDVGIRANRLDEMPDERGGGREAEAVVTVKNSGTGPERILDLSLGGDIPNPRNPDDEGIGIYDPDIPGETHEPVSLNSAQQRTLFTSTLPFLFEGDGIDCSPEPQSGEMTVTIEGDISGEYSEEYRIDYTASESYDGCDISLPEV